MGHVVISYSREDAPFVDRLVSELEAAGVTVWLDRTRIGSGDWERKIQRAIEGSTDLVIVVSPRSEASDRVRDEFAFAREILSADHVHPVILEPVRWLGLGRFHQHDATDGRVPADLVELLRPPSPDPPPARSKRPSVKRSGRRRPARRDRDLVTEPCWLEVGHSGPHSWQGGRPMVDVRLPPLGETVSEGIITRWFRDVGEPVDVEQPLCEVSTDKVDTELPSPASGRLTDIIVPEGETVEIGTVLGRIAADSTAPRAGSLPAVDACGARGEVGEG